MAEREAHYHIHLTLNGNKFDDGYFSPTLTRWLRESGYRVSYNLMQTLTHRQIGRCPERHGLIYTLLFKR